ncbi:hypothetical protein [Azospirillum sp. B4]|uniref:hypothetical protein n=1 Tax=Azospirillum sp. B4 TaxID=95605 RepID=UPI000346DD67|nr:hypothetical protein [Azospirillum sp. B4]
MPDRHFPYPAKAPRPAKRPGRGRIGMVIPGTPEAMHLKRAQVELDRVATRVHETAFASAHTINARLGLLAQTGGDPVALGTNPEFERMGREKVEAFADSALALVGGMRAFQDAWWRWRDHQVDALGEFARATWSSWHPGDWVTAERRLVTSTLRAATGAFTRFSHATSRLGGLGLAPIHRAASANARRLSLVPRLLPHRAETAGDGGG